MRITNRMLNESAKRTGMQVNNMSLLSLVNSGRNNKYMYEKLSDIKAAKAIDTESKKKYETLGDASEKLSKAADALLLDGDKSIFKEKEDNSHKKAIQEGIKSFVDRYNENLKELKNVSGVMNDFYREMMVEAAGESKEKLEKVGISFQKDGTISIDGDKLKAADTKDLEALFGSKSDFVKKVKFISGRVSNNAETNIKSFSNSYSSKGDLRSNTTKSKYDFRG